MLSSCCTSSGAFTSQYRRRMRVFCRQLIIIKYRFSKLELQKRNQRVIEWVRGRANEYVHIPRIYPNKRVAKPPLPRALMSKLPHTGKVRTQHKAKRRGQYNQLVLIQVRVICFVGLMDLRAVGSSPVVTSSTHTC